MDKKGNFGNAYGTTRWHFLENFLFAGARWALLLLWRNTKLMCAGHAAIRSFNIFKNEKIVGNRRQR